MNPMLIDDHYSIIAGHGRILAAKEEGEIKPIRIYQVLERNTKITYILNNNLALNVGWDMVVLILELD